MKSILSTIFTGTKVYKTAQAESTLSKNMVQWGMSNRSDHSRKKGFSLVELMLTTVGILVLSAVSYKVIRTQNIFQISAIEENQRQNIANSALDQFKRDASKIDPNWIKLGVASVFPHPGYAKRENFYLNASGAEAGLSDAVTFLTIAENRSGVHRLKSQNLYHGPYEDKGASVGLYLDEDDHWIEIDNSNIVHWGSTFRKGDWVLVYEKGKYALGVVKDTIISPPNALKIKLHPIADMPYQKTESSIEGSNSGLVTTPGPVLGSYDYLANEADSIKLTSDDTDDFIRFSYDQTFLQVVQPVTYALEWLTENGGPNSPINPYVRDAQGNPQPVLVRSQYVYDEDAEVKIQKKYENLAKITELGFTYDMMVSENNAGNQTLSGYLAGEIARDIGRQSGAEPVGFMSLEEYDGGSTSFLATSNIVGIRMMVANKWQEREQTLVAKNDVKVALDPTFRDIQFQEDHLMTADMTKDMHDKMNLGATHHIGQPLYFKAPNSQEGYIVLPVMDLINPEEGSDETPSAGKLVFMDRYGNPVVASDEVASTVNIGDSQHQFYPTEVQTIKRGDKTFLVATGMGIENEVRVPMMATIDISEGEISERLENANGSGTMCSLEGCKLHVLGAESQGTSLKDTVNGFIEYNGEIYISSLTKDNGDMDSVKLYKTNVNATGNEVNIDPFTEVVVNNDGDYTSENRVLSAIGNEIISHNGQDYLPVCMSRSIPQCTAPLSEEEGEIVSDSGGCAHFPRKDGAVYLYDMAGSSSPIKVASHNYLCTALQSVGDNILVGGRLVTQIIHEGTIIDILNGTLGDGDDGFPMLYTDEVYDSSEYPYHYADAYYPLNVNFPNNPQNNGSGPIEYASAITWNSGTMVQLFPDGRLGVALGNRTIPKFGAELTSQGVITMDMDPGGMRDRIFSNIRTELANLNTSEVSNVYHQGNATFSTDVILPGVLYGGVITAPSGATRPRRITPMVLPLIAEQGMDESQWKDFFLDYYDPADRANSAEYNVDIPVNGPLTNQCTNGYPSTCAFN